MRFLLTLIADPQHRYRNARRMCGDMAKEMARMQHVIRRKSVKARGSNNGCRGLGFGMPTLKVLPNQAYSRRASASLSRVRRQSAACAYRSLALGARRGRHRHRAARVKAANSAWRTYVYARGEREMKRKARCLGCELHQRLHWRRPVTHGRLLLPQLVILSY